MNIPELKRQLEHTQKERDVAIKWYEDAKGYVYRTEGALTMIESLLAREEAVAAALAAAAETSKPESSSTDDTPDDDPNPTIH